MVIALRRGQLQQLQGQPQIPVCPGTDGHRPARVIKRLTSIPVEGVFIALVSVACQACRHAVLSHAWASPTLWVDMVDRFRSFAAVNAALVSELVQGLTPASEANLGTKILQKHSIAELSIPGLHEPGLAAVSFAAVPGVAMCRGLPFHPCAAFCSWGLLVGSR